MGTHNDSTPEDQHTGPDRRGAREDQGASPVPGPGTEGAEEGYHSMHAPEERRPDTELYNVAPPTMPPSPAGADADIGGEAAASRRLAGLPPELAQRAEHRTGEATPDAEPFLGYDGLDTDGVLGWIADADPTPDRLEAIAAYEQTHRNRAPIIRECQERIRRFEA